MGHAEQWTSAQLLDQYSRGQKAAADEIFTRYADRMILLARTRLSSRLAARIDPEDVALSAWRSFFVGAREGQFALNAPGDLWRLLASITLHKVCRQARRHGAARRAIDRDQSLQLLPEDKTPTTKRLLNGPEGQLALTEKVDAIMAKLDAPARRILDLRLQGEKLGAIALRTGRSERTVRRTLARIRHLLVARIGTDNSHGRPPGKQRSLGIENRRRPKAIGHDAQFEPGRLLDPDGFLLQQMIGAGRFGKIYRARQLDSGRTVAIKYLRKGFLSRPEIVDRFLQEASMLARLDHPGIVGHRGLGRTTGGSYFIVMNWIDGPTLAELLATGPVAVDRVLRWMQQLCDALGHAHQKGILHCDLKPNNVLVDGQDHVYLTDFGLSRSLEEENRFAHHFEGTPAFMAPEQVMCARGQLGRQTDVYGVGALLFTLLTGRPPWGGQSLSDILAGILSGGEVVDPRILRPELSQGISQICRRCLAKEATSRYRSMKELCAALGKLD